MYRKNLFPQLNLFTQEASVMEVLDPEDEIVKLAHTINWQVIDELYSRSFKNKNKRGNPNVLSARIAFGSLIMKQYTGLSDAQLAQEIKRNPYWQYFLGCTTFSPEHTFDSSTLVSFRKQFPPEFLEEINLANLSEVIEKWDNSKDDESNNNDDQNHSGTTSTDSNSDTSQAAVDSNSSVLNKGTVIIDATCCPADIKYPTDLDLLNSSRLWTEQIIDSLFEEYGPLSSQSRKPRTYRRKARRQYHQFVKHPRVRKTKKMRKIIGEQLSYVKRNLGYIDQYIFEHPDCLDSLRSVERKRLDTIRVLYAQQREMYEKKSHNVPDRIISLSQPHVRPIVRGKQKSKVEFGAKMSMSVINGFCFIDELSFDSYNEGAHDHFVQVIEKYRERFGFYPERVMADKIYGNRQNRKWCKEHGIYLSAEPLGRKPKDQRKLLKQMCEDMGVRNEVECKFGNMKRRDGLNLIMSKLAESAKTEIHLSVICRNLVNLVRFSQA